MLFLIFSALSTSVTYLVRSAFDVVERVMYHLNSTAIARATSEICTEHVAGLRKAFHFNLRAKSERNASGPCHHNGELNWIYEVREH